MVMDYFKSALYEHIRWSACWCRYDRVSKDRAMYHRLARRLIRQKDRREAEDCYGN